MNRMESDMITRRSSSSSNPLDHNILDNDPDDLSIPWNAANGRLQGRYPQHLPELSHLGDGKQEPLHTSWNLPQPVREDIDRMHDESMAGRGMANAEAESLDTSSSWTGLTDMHDLLNLRLEDWISPELLSRLNALIAAMPDPGPETEFDRTEHRFPYSYHKGLSKPYVCECIGCNRSFGTKSEMEKHQKNHVDKQNMPCVCPECGDKFALRHYLARHFKSVHLKERPFPCDQCDKWFTRKDGLEVHKRRLHSTTASSSGAPKTPKTPSTGSKRRRPSKATASSSSSQLKRLASRMDGIEIASSSSFPSPSTPTPRRYQ